MQQNGLKIIIIRRINMLVDELRELTGNSKQYQKEYEEIVRKLREIAENGLMK